MCLRVLKVGKYINMYKDQSSVKLSINIKIGWTTVNSL